MQNIPCLALLRPIFALKTKIALPSMVLAMKIDEGSDVISSQAETQFLFGDHLNLGRKTVSILVKTFFCFFFGDHQYLDAKTDSIRLNTDQNLGQDRLMLFPAPKQPHPHCKFLATRLTVTVKIHSTKSNC